MTYISTLHMIYHIHMKVNCQRHLYVRDRELIYSGRTAAVYYSVRTRSSSIGCTQCATRFLSARVRILLWLIFHVYLGGKRGLLNAADKFAEFVEEKEGNALEIRSPRSRVNWIAIAVNFKIRNHILHASGLEIIDIVDHSTFAEMLYVCSFFFNYTFFFNFIVDLLQPRELERIKFFKSFIWSKKKYVFF